ncbi:MAG: hypothetical protein IJY09_05660 [Lachnospiraceae bacterium]|nr:hypothetical protein [Lachnospiraceae bacterium]
MYMKRACSQIEGITCALSVYIENAIDVAKDYHYRVYNELMNEIRGKHIGAIIQIQDVFRETRDSIEDIAERIHASDLVKKVLHEEVQQFDECLSRLVIRCKNIRECNSSTENPNIPNANDEIYESFAGYKNLINEYPLDIPSEDDIVSGIIYSFYKETRNTYYNLFDEYDKILDGLGGELQERRRKGAEEKQKKALGIVKKGTIAENIVKATIVATSGIIGGIRKKEIFYAVDAGLGLIKTISEELDDVLPKKSIARQALKGIESFGKSMDLISGIGIQEAYGIDDNTMSAVKIIGAVVGVSKFDLHKLNKDGKLSTMVNVAEATVAWTDVVGSAVSRKPLVALSRLPKAVDKTMNLVKSMSDYYADNNVHELPKAVEDRMRGLAKKIKGYETDRKNHQANLIRGIPSRKPKAPPWMRIHKGMTFVSGSIEKIRKLIGGDYNDIVTKIL